MEGQEPGEVRPNRQKRPFWIQSTSPEDNSSIGFCSVRIVFDISSFFIHLWDMQWKALFFSLQVFLLAHMSEKAVYGKSLLRYVLFHDYAEIAWTQNLTGSLLGPTMCYLLAKGWIKMTKCQKELSIQNYFHPLPTVVNNATTLRDLANYVIKHKHFQTHFCDCNLYSSALCLCNGFETSLFSPFIFHYVIRVKPDSRSHSSSKLTCLNNEFNLLTQ